MSQTEEQKQQEMIMRRRQHLMLLIYPTSKKYQRGGTFYNMLADTQGPRVADETAKVWVERLAKAAEAAQCDISGKPL